MMPTSSASADGRSADAADRGRERGHERLERVAVPPPVAVDLEEGLELEQAADAPVLRRAPVAAEQPRVHRDALLALAVEDLAGSRPGCALR